MKAAIINQTINTTWQTPTTTIFGIPVPITSFSSATETLQNNFKGSGPAIGLNTSWPILATTKGSLNLFANFTAALLWGHWHFTDNYQNNTPIAISVNLSNVNGAAPMSGAFVGMEWSSLLPMHRAYLCMQMF